MTRAKNGLYGLISLDGAPMQRGDLEVMGLEDPRPDPATFADDAIRIALSDRTATADSGIATRGQVVVGFLGDLDDQPSLCADLGLSLGAPAAQIVLRALDKWGEDAWARLKGEWSVIHVDRAARSLILAASPALRDDLYFATSGARVAIAPQALLLRRLGWATRDLDPLGFTQAMSSWAYRSRREGRTPYTGVSFVEWGQRVRIGADGRVDKARFDGLRPPPPWQGSFTEAAAELELKARRAVRRRLRRHGAVAISFSGGLDSSAMAWLAAQERAAGQSIFAVSSVSPPGSGAPDERAYIEAGAAALGLPVRFVSPPDNADILIPPAYLFAHAEQPVIGPRHYLYEALYAAARDGGAGVLLDGAMGEFSLSRRTSLATLEGRARRLRQALRDLIGDPAANRAPSWPRAGLLVEPSKAALDLLTSAFGAAPIERPDGDPFLRPAAPMGYPPGVLKVGKWQTDTPGGELRHLKPFFDRGMIDLVSSAPASFAHAAGLPRSFVRAMLAGYLPEAIVRRTDKGPFSPDFYQRLRRHAPAARARLPEHRAAGADAWLDLDWLERMLGVIARRPLAPAIMFRIQNTAIAAEFLVWLRASGGG
jgi:asparagine synthase (glutamine-hydrolysing)